MAHLAILIQHLSPKGTRQGWSSAAIQQELLSAWENNTEQAWMQILEQGNGFLPFE